MTMMTAIESNEKLILNHFESLLNPLRPFSFWSSALRGVAELGARLRGELAGRAQFVA